MNYATPFVKASIQTALIILDEKPSEPSARGQVEVLLDWS